MSDLRLTRRGRLLLQTLPLFLVTSTAIQVLAHRTSERTERRRSVAAATTPEAPAATTPAAAPSTARPVTPLPAATSPATSPTPRPTPKPTPVATRPPRATYASSGDLVTVPGSSRVHGSGRLRRFTVEVERGLAVDPAAIASAVESVLFDPRGWAGTGRTSFQRVSSGPVSFRVTLASPRTTDRLCAPLDTGGIYSCWNGSRAVLNAMRWTEGASSYRGDLASYRIYMVNHEVGHGLGHGHTTSCGAGRLAPVMMQQTKSLYGCRRNPWPLPAEQ